MKLPANSVQSTVAESKDAATTEEPLPHGVECEVLHRLQNHPSLKFSRLSVHQCDHDSIFLDGSLESNDDEIDLCEVVRGIHGIKIVVNRVMNIHPRPKKG
jgi:osmotically-inducible protein OsmY